MKYVILCTTHVYFIFVCLFVIPDKLDDQARARFLNACIPPEKYKGFRSIIVSETGRKPSIRSFNHSHITGINSCFAYSAKDGGIYCKLCLLFAPCNDTNGAFKFNNPSIVKQLICEAFTNVKKATEKLKEHLKTEYHAAAAMNENNFSITNTTGNDVSAMIHTQHSIIKQQNRQKMVRIFRAINWLARQGLSLRGHRDSGSLILSEDENGAAVVDHTRGNFHALLQLLAEDDPVLREHLINSASKAKYICPMAQNDMLQAMGNVLTAKLVEQINAAQYITVMADETTDVSHKEQMVVCIRFVDNETLDNDLSAAGITEKILQTLSYFGLTPQIVGQE